MVKRIPVGAYIRVSSVGGRSGDSFISPELQREAIERVCQRENLEVVQTVQELDASGGDSSREGWNNLIQEVEVGNIKGIVTWNLSRFSRSVKDALAALERVENAGGKLYSEEGQLGKFPRTVLFAVSEYERDRAREGFRNAAANAIRRGIYIAGKIPYGYKRDVDRTLVLDPETAPIVVQLFERRVKGQSWAQLSKWSMQEHDQYFARSTLSTMLKNHAYVGHATYGDIVNEHAHEPIISKLLFDQAQGAAGKKPVSTGRSENLLLRGIARCSSCGHALIINNSKGAKGQRFPIYHCRNLKCEDHANVRADYLDEYVVAHVLAFLSSAEATIKTKKNDPKELAKAEQELEEAEYALQQFKANKKAITILGLDAWNELLEEYVVTRDVAQLHRDSLKDENPIDEFNLVPELWKEWTNESRREFLQKVIGACSITPAHRQKLPISERVEFGLNLAGTEMELTTRSIVTRQKPAAVVWSQE
jgi:site-specific DNA recombinase